ncbi:ABC transporter ATP-binding protein [Streptomyces sp. NPDC088812]|uniref:ABC transporter ATP-binding protein n=1 Tax=Streptomyces sp. NPDC088812 TaxID=3365905 RepID=UPI00382D437C
MSATRTGLPVASPVRTRRYARSLLRGARAQVATVLLLNAAAAGAALVVPHLLGRMTDLIARHPDGLVDRLDKLTLWVGAALVLQTALTFAAARATFDLGERMASRLRLDFMERVVHLPLSVVERAGTGDLLARTTLDTGEVNHTAQQALPQLLGNAVTACVVVTGAFATSPSLTLAVLVIVPVLLPVVRWYLRRAPAAFADVLARHAELSATVAETADGATSVEALGWQARRTARTQERVERMWAAQRRTLRLRCVLFPALDLGALLPCMTTLLLGGLLAADGRVGLQEVATVALMMQMLAAPVVEVVRSLDSLHLGSASLRRLVGVADIPSDRSVSDAVPAPGADPVLRLEAVHFGYAPGRPVLTGVDLTVRRGERLALVGPTGAGKSTLGRIIAGIHPPDTGTATAGGAELTSLTDRRLRATVLLTTQEQHLFLGTLADNLRMARPQADDAELERVLTLVGAAEWADALPEGLATPVGGHRTDLGPAQLQQVALARLLLARPDVLVLDEATSMMSPTAAHEVESGLNRVLAGRTVVAIAHRLHTAYDADRIAVVDRGRVVEAGTHDELLAAQGVYSRLWTSWRGDSTA